MKKLLFLLLPLLMGAGDGDAVVRALQTRIKALGDYTVEFEVYSDGHVEEGVYSVSGEKLWMSAVGSEVILNGNQQWMIIPADREVHLKNVGTRTGNFMENPVHAFEFAPEVFSSRLVEGGVVLTPRDGSAESITVIIDLATGLPRELRFGELTVRITSMKKGTPPAARFSFDKSRYPNFEVVDFR